MSALIHQNTPEWLELRKSCVGASDAPVLMGDSPWDTPFSRWQEKVGLKPPKMVSPYMQRGLDLEDIARKEFQNMIGFEVIPKVCFHSEYTWMIASLDGMNEFEKKIVEIKCASKDDHGTAKKGKVPKKYYAQLQHQLAVTGLKMAYYFSFDGTKGVIVEVNRDDLYIERLIEKAIDFKRCIDQFIPPELTDKEKRQSECQYTEDLHVERVAERYFDLGEQLDDLIEQREDYKQRLIALSGGSDTMGRGFKLSKVVTKGRIDYDALLSHHKVDADLERFRKPQIESWRISKVDD